MQQETAVPPTSKIEELESWLTLKPKDLRAIRQLVTMLEFAPNSPASAGAFSAAQASMIAALEEEWHKGLLDPDLLVEQFHDWLAVLESNGLSQAVPIGQVFSGRTLQVKGQSAHCGPWLKFFKETGVIPALCNDCYKVQILPHDLAAMFQTYALLQVLNLPNDNARKCMIELRDGIKFPYKAYIYCDTVEDVRICLQAFRELQATHGITGISSKISHGCSEYGQKYPAFKYSEEPVSPKFEPKPEWHEIENNYFKSVNWPAQKRSSNYRQHVSLRDVFGFYTWVRYAEMIGDPTSRGFAGGWAPSLPLPFVERVRTQAAVRSRELGELRQGV